MSYVGEYQARSRLIFVTDKQWIRCLHTELQSIISYILIVGSGHLQEVNL